MTNQIHLRELARLFTTAKLFILTNNSVLKLFHSLIVFKMSVELVCGGLSDTKPVDDATILIAYEVTEGNEEKVLYYNNYVN